MSEIDTLINSCLLPAFHGSTPPAWVRTAVDDGLAGVCLYGHNITAPGSVTDVHGRIAETGRTLRESAADVLVALDEEGGDVTRMDYLVGSRYPGNLALGVVDDELLTRSTGHAIGSDLREIGINLALAPSVDVNSDPDNPVIGVRSFGSDPALVARQGAAFVAGMQAAGVAATAKHFPGHGATVVDSHLGLPVVDVTMETFRSRDLPPFAAAIEAGVAVVMTSHVVFPALDDQPGTLSRRVLVDLLRAELGFRGPVITDALDMAGVRAAHGLVGAAARSLAAGADLLLLGAEDGEEQLPALREAIRRDLASGLLPEGRLHEAAGRVAALRERLHRGTFVERAGDAGTVGATAARRALVVRGVRPLGRPAVVAEVRHPANMAVGAAKWSLAEALARHSLVERAVQVDGSGTTPASVLAEAQGHPLVVAVRDAYRHEWQRSWLSAVLEARPDATVVGIGMPQDAGLTAGPMICTHGASAASTAAAAEVLAGV